MALVLLQCFYLGFSHKLENIEGLEAVRFCIPYSQVERLPPINAVRIHIIAVGQQVLDKIASDVCWPVKVLLITRCLRNLGGSPTCRCQVRKQIWRCQPRATRGRPRRHRCC